jgi:SRSO17 transposase
MDAVSICGLQPELDTFLRQFSHCTPDDLRSHVHCYVEGQLSELERKNVERIALNAGATPRTLQEFLARYEWDHEAMRDQLQRIVAAEHSGLQSIGIIDETSFVKKGDKTPGVQRQHCGAVGKHENCIVTVHLSYACGDFHCLLDGDLFLPESWANDRTRCHEARIPDDMTYRPKSEIALELYDRSISNGLSFSWLTFDEWYGAKPAFLDALERRRQTFVGEIHRNHMMWVKCPRITHRPYRKNGRGPGRKTPRLVSGSPKARHAVQCIEQAPEFANQSWERWHVKDTQKGPKVIEVKHAIVYPKNAEGLPAKAHHLIVVRDVLAPNDVKFFLSNAAQKTSLEVLLKVAFSRWRVERCFEDDKSYVGLDHYEGRRYPGLLRHLILSAVSLLFLAQARQRLLESYPELTVSQVRQATSAVVQSWWLTPLDAERLISHTAYRLEYYQRRNAQARASHTRTRVRKLASMGIDVNAISKCQWDTG